MFFSVVSKKNPDSLSSSSSSQGESSLEAEATAVGVEAVVARRLEGTCARQGLGPEVDAFAVGVGGGASGFERI